MNAAVQWAPYRGKMHGQVRLMGVAECGYMSGYAVADMQSPPDARIIAFTGEKVEKMCIGSFQKAGQFQYGLCVIFPKYAYRLPVFISRWEEREKEITFLVDMLPTVDFLLDKDFRAKYLEALGPLWEKCAGLPGICPEEDDVLRSACSIIYTAARMPVEREGMRHAALAPHIEYLGRYADFLKSAGPVDDEAKTAEVRRKVLALTDILRGHFQQDFNRTVAPVVGSEKVGPILDIFF